MWLEAVGPWLDLDIFGPEKRLRKKTRPILKQSPAVIKKTSAVEIKVQATAPAFTWTSRIHDCMKAETPRHPQSTGSCMTGDQLDALRIVRHLGSAEGEPWLSTCLLAAPYQTIRP